jgi:hypothetical protein
LFAGLLLLAALLLPGCKKSKKPTEPEGPQGNPILPGPGQMPQGGGAIQAVRRAAWRTDALNKLNNFSLAYYQYTLLNNRPPSGLDDIKDSLDADTIAAFKEGYYKANWNVRDTSAETMVAYVDEAEPSGMRIVARADGKAARWSREQFEAALKKK